MLKRKTENHLMITADKQTNKKINNKSKKENSKQTMEFQSIGRKEKENKKKLLLL